MEGMARVIKHISLHRAGDTELRVVADVEDGVLPVIQVEEGVIRGYVQHHHWPHRWVTLFILEDLQPLVRQLPAGGRLPPGDTPAMDDLPVVNAYDLADLSSCHVFINRQAMGRHGYWHDRLAIQGLLAHEHAHPLAENETVRASRSLQLEISWQNPAGTGASQSAAPDCAPLDIEENTHRLWVALAHKLCLVAPREIFANQMTVTGGFGEALLHLDQRNVANARRSLAGRDQLVQQLQQKVAAGRLSAAAADGLLLFGDLNGYLELAIEVASFYRSGAERAAWQLDTALETDVFPHLAPEVLPTYTALRQSYVALPADLTPGQLREWAVEILSLLASPLAEKGWNLDYRVRVVDTRDGTEGVPDS
jgi:hypothetical protein